MTSAYASSDNERQQGCPVPVQRPSDVRETGARAVIYIRVASPERAESEHSITAQREACLRKARELGLSIHDDYVDPHARLWRRPKCQLIDACSRGSAAGETQQAATHSPLAASAQSRRQDPLADFTVLHPGRLQKEAS
jgi:hypothetical protein